MTFKTTDVAKWTMDDIEVVKKALPENVEFGSLSSSNKSSVEVNVGYSVEHTQLQETVDEVRTAFERDLGLPVDNIRVKGGYSGTVSPTTLLVVQLGEK